MYINKKDLTTLIRERLKMDENNRCTNAFLVLSSPEVLRLAYETIKSKPGNMTKGVDGETLDGIDMEWFEKKSKELIVESFKPRPARRKYIPKANGKMRPLGISPPQWEWGDKIIQQAMRIVMEEILEPRFHPSSHGFRPNRGCHTALEQIRN